jgi:hypothetical protein
MACAAGDGARTGAVAWFGVGAWAYDTATGCGIDVAVACHVGAGAATGAACANSCGRGAAGACVGAAAGAGAGAGAAICAGAGRASDELDENWNRGSSRRGLVNAGRGAACCRGCCSSEWDICSPPGHQRIPLPDTHSLLTDLSGNGHDSSHSVCRAAGTVRRDRVRNAVDPSRIAAICRPFVKRDLGNATAAGPVTAAIGATCVGQSSGASAPRGPRIRHDRCRTHERKRDP